MPTKGAARGRKKNVGSQDEAVVFSKEGESEIDMSHVKRTLTTETAPSSPTTDDRDEAVVFLSKSHDEDDELDDLPINTTTSEPRVNAADAAKDLGPGPLRFAAFGERPIAHQIASLSPKQKACMDNLKTRWKEAYPDKPFSDEMYLRFARCSPGPTKFNEKTAWRVMQRFDRRYLVLTATRLESQLLSKTLFPIPGLETNDGHEIFYMRPSRYFPKQTSTKAIIDNLAYCMTTMVEKEKSCTEGIGFLAYMNDWKMQNFSVDYCLQFMRMLQGRVPVRVRLFLIVNPPAWFGKIWQIMKPMLAKDFRQKVHIVQEDELEHYLMPFCKDYLPDDMDTGTMPTDEIMCDFVTYRKYVEKKTHYETSIGNGIL